MVCLECGGFQLQSCRLVDAEHEVHVLYGLANGTFQKVVNARGNENLALETIDMHQCLVGVYHLLQVNGLVAIVGESSIAVVFLVGSNDVAGGGVGLDDGGAEDATGEVAAVWNEVYRSIQLTLFLCQRLTYLGDVLVLEGLIDAQVVHAP